MENTLVKTRRKFFAPNISISFILLLISLVFILLFTYTGINKLADLGKFQGAMIKSPPLAPYAKILSYSVPILELIIAVLLAFPNFNEDKNSIPKARKIGLYASFLLMALFTGYVYYILSNYAVNLPCTCGGIINDLTWRQHLWFNIFLLLLSAWSLFLLRKQNKLNKINQ